MITKEMIKNGIDQGIIRFIVDPNMEHGTVCAIGDNWFYFGGKTAAEENPEEYIKNIPMEDIVLEVFDTLGELKTEFPDEYLYYEYYLQENLKAKESSKTLLVVNFINVEENDDSEVGFDIRVKSRIFVFNGDRKDAEELEDGLCSAFDSDLVDKHSDEEIVELALSESGHKYTEVTDGKIPACDGYYIINV